MTVKADTDKTFIEDALDFASREQRYMVADALFCSLTNTGQQLDGNTAENDSEWLAREIWRDYASRRPLPEDIDKATAEQRSEWNAIARTCIKIMPRLQQRIASRLIALSKVLADIELVERRAYKAAGGK